MSETIAGVVHELSPLASVAGYSYACDCGWAGYPRQTYKERNTEGEQHLNAARALRYWYIVWDEPRVDRSNAAKAADGQGVRVSVCYSSKHSAMLAAGATASKKVSSGVYRVEGAILTRDVAAVMCS